MAKVSLTGGVKQMLPGWQLATHTECLLCAGQRPVRETTVKPIC